MSTELATEAITIEPRSLEGSSHVLRVSRQARLQDLLDVSSCPPLLRRALSGPLSWQQRTEITIHQALLGPNLVPTWIGALMANGVQVTSDQPADEPCDLVSYLSRAARKRGILAAVLIPLDVPNRSWGTSQVCLTPADRPLVTATAVLDVTEDRIRRARLALTGVWPQHIRMTEAAETLIGVPLCRETIERAAEAVRREVEPVGDFLASADYRRAMAGVVSRRALVECMDQVKGQRR